MTNPPANAPMECPKCGSPVQPGIKFCESCGAKIESQPVCTPLIPGTKFCESCGTPAGAVSVAPPASPAPSSKPDTPQKPKTPAPVSPPKPGGTAPVAGSPSEKKPASRSTLLIAGVVVLLVIAAAVYFVGLPMLSAKGTGQTNPGAQSFPSPAATNLPAPAQGSSSASQTAAPATPTLSRTGSLVPGPIDSLPSDIAVTFQVDKDAINGKITVMLTGGQGRTVIRDCLVTVTHPDGTMVTGIISPNKKVNEITLDGSKGTDRVEVLVTYYSGQQYKVIDQLMPFNKRIDSG